MVEINWKIVLFIYLFFKKEVEKTILARVVVSPQAPEARGYKHSCCTQH